MKTQILPAGAPNAIALALEVLRAGGLVAFTTDTVYGLGALAFDGVAVQSLYIAKDRPAEKAMPVLLGDVVFLDQVATGVPIMARQLAARFWPGPLTLVVPKNPELPEAVSGIPTVGVRVPDHRFARDLLQAAGPMAVTSANVSGHPNAYTAQEALTQLDGRLAMILDGGRTRGTPPSTVVDCTQLEPVILRLGSISLMEIRSALA
jgi:L-threonylcarbamoyladenylate synthase